MNELLNMVTNKSVFKSYERRYRYEGNILQTSVPIFFEGGHRRRQPVTGGAGPRAERDAAARRKRPSLNPKIPQQLWS